MKIEILAFLAATLLLFVTFSSHTQENLVKENYDNLDNKISFASLAVTAPLYLTVPELPIVDSINELYQIDAKSFKIGILGHDSSVYNFEDTIRWPIASLTKLLTAVVAIEKLGLDKIIQLTQEDILIEGDTSNLKPGELFSVHDLIVAMLTVSSNDAAYALARSYNYGNFIEAMRDKAFAIGMANSFFIDPTGLSTINQSTSRDLEKLANYIFDKYPNLLATSRNKENFIIENGSGRIIKLSNINKFAGDFDFVGGKTGYIEEARGNLLSIFNWQSQNILIIVLGSNDRFLDTSKLYNWTKNRLK